MAYLGHDWVRATVSEIERAGRNITVEELVALTIVFDATVLDLLDPLGIEGTRTEDVELRMGVRIAGPNVSRWIRGERVFAPALSWDDEGNTGGLVYMGGHGSEPMEHPETQVEYEGER